MGEVTNISWADHTWSPWLGCEPISPGCKNCYASAISKRAGRGEYRRGMPRTLTKDWKAPERWNKQAHALAALDEACGRSQSAMPRVFPSMMDPFDEAVPNDWKLAFFDTIRETLNLTWLLLTKRPEAAKRFFEEQVFTNSDRETLPLCEREPFIRHFLPNLWIGVSVENQEQADKRIPVLLSIPATVRFVSAEPLLGPIDLRYSAFNGADSFKSLEGIHWVIIGGESGFNHRRMELAWMQSIHDQCKAAGVPCFIKQDSARFPGHQGRIPEELWKCKEFPKL